MATPAPMYVREDSKDGQIRFTQVVTEPKTSTEIRAQRKRLDHELAVAKKEEKDKPSPKRIKRNELAKEGTVNFYDAETHESFSCVVPWNVSMVDLKMRACKAFGHDPSKVTLFRSRTRAEVGRLCDLPVYGGYELAAVKTAASSDDSSDDSD